jgi:hypothetical protein
VNRELRNGSGVEPDDRSDFGFEAAFDGSLTPWPSDEDPRELADQIYYKNRSPDHG